MSPPDPCPRGAGGCRWWPVPGNAGYPALEKGSTGHTCYTPPLQPLPFHATAFTSVTVLIICTGSGWGNTHSAVGSLMCTGQQHKGSSPPPPSPSILGGGVGGGVLTIWTRCWAHNVTKETGNSPNRNWKPCAVIPASTLTTHWPHLLCFLTLPINIFFIVILILLLMCAFFSKYPFKTFYHSLPVMSCTWDHDKIVAKSKALHAVLWPSFSWSQCNGTAVYAIWEGKCFVIWGMAQHVSQEPLLLLQRVTTVGSLTPDHRLRETTPLLRPFCCCWNLSLHNNSMSIKPNDTPYLIKTTLVLIWEGSERRRSTVGCVPVP